MPTSTGLHIKNSFDFMFMFHLVLEQGQVLVVHSLEIIVGHLDGTTSIWKHSMGKGYCYQ